MKSFAYKARDKQGKLLTGTVEGDDKEVAIKKLRQQGYLITSLKEQNSSHNFSLLAGKHRPKPKQLAVLCRQFSLELTAGMSIVRSLELLEDQAADASLRRVLQQIRLDLASGVSFTRSLEKHTSYFPHVFIHLVEAGEVAGALPRVLEQLAIYYEREDELRKRVSEALMYPAIIFTVAILMVFVLLFFVLPMLISNFASFGVQPPLLTRKVLTGRDWLADNFLLVAVALAGLIVVASRVIKRPAVRYRLDSLFLRLPIIGPIGQMVSLSRLCRALGLLLNSGVSMVESLQIGQRLLTNLVYNQALGEALLGVQRGQELSALLKQANRFPQMFVQMVAVGEETGNLENSLIHLADYYDREVNYSVSSMTKLIEPVVMLILAVVVLFILLSVYLPMMEMVTHL